MFSSAESFFNIFSKKLNTKIIRNLLITILLFFSLSTFAQSDEETHIYRGLNSIYFEIGGVSMKPFSINYDRVLFIKEETYFSLSIGFGSYGVITDYKGYSIPISFSSTTGVHKKNHFEMGLGLTYSEKKFKDYKNEKIIYGGFRLAYKYQAKEKLFFKVGISPFTKLISFQEKSENFLLKDIELLLNFFQISIGYTF